MYSFMETNQYPSVKHLNLPFIKAISIKEKEDIKRNLTITLVIMIFLDSGKGPHRGGNGTTFNWDYSEPLILTGEQLILAGGLNLIM